MEKLSERSYDKFSLKSEKSVGTDVSGVASMIKNNNFTIMVYSNSEAGSVCSGPPGKVQVVRNADPDAQIEAIIRKNDCEQDCDMTDSKTPNDDNGEYHNHGVYIQRKASTLSSGSTTSFSSHCCESHMSEYSRSKSANPHSLVSKSDTMDNISDILNVSNDPRRSVSPRATSQGTRETSPGLFIVTSEEGCSEPPEEPMIDEHLYSPKFTVPSDFKANLDIPLLSDESVNGFTPPVEHSTPEKEPAGDVIGNFFTPSSKCASSVKSSSSSDDSKHSPGERILHSSSAASKESEKFIDDLLDKYTSPLVETPEIEKLQESNVTLTSDPSEPCMVPQKSSDNIPELLNQSSPLLERVRKQSLGKDNVEFIDEKLFESSSEEEEEPFVGNDSYLTHSSHYSESEDGADNLSNIVEEPSLETCSATEMIERRVSESITDLQEPLREDPIVEIDVDGPLVDMKSDAVSVPIDKTITEPGAHFNVLIIQDDDTEITFDVESIDDDFGKDIMVSEERFVSVNTLPDFISHPDTNKEEDMMSVKSITSESSKASSKDKIDLPELIEAPETNPFRLPTDAEESKSQPLSSCTKPTLEQSLSEEKLTMSPANDDVLKSSSIEDSKSNPETAIDAPTKPMKKSPSNGSLSRIPVRRGSQSSSGSKERSRSSSRESSLRNSRISSFQSDDKKSKRSSRSSSAESLSKIPVRRNSRGSSSESEKRKSPVESIGKNSRRTSRSSSSESLTRIPIRRTSKEKPRKNSNGIIKSPSKESIKSDQSGQAKSKPTSHSKPPLPRSPSKDRSDGKKDPRRMSSSDSKDSFEKCGKPDSENATRENSLIVDDVPKSNPLETASQREVFDGIATKTFSRPTSKESLASKSDTSSKRKSPSPSRIPTRRSRTDSKESLLSSASVSSRSSFAYKRSKSPKQSTSPSRIPVSKSPSSSRKPRYSTASVSSISSNTSEPYTTGHAHPLTSASKDSMISRHSTISNLSEPQLLDGDQVSLPREERSGQLRGSDDGLPHHRKDSSSSSSTDKTPPVAYFDVVGIDQSQPVDEKMDQAILERQSNRSRNSDRSLKSMNSINSKHSTSSRRSDRNPTTKTSLINEDDSLSECSGSFISDNSFLRNHHSAQIAFSDSDDSNSPISTKKIMLDRILSGGYRNQGENLGFMDNLSEHDGSVSLTGVSSEGIEKVGSDKVASEGVVSDSSLVWREGKVEPLGLTSIEPMNCKHIVIGDAPEDEIADLNTLHFPTMSDYVRWSQNQSLSGRSFDVDSIGSMKNYDEIEFSDGEKTTLEREMLYKYAKYQKQQSLAEVEKGGKKLEDILNMDEISLTSSKIGSENGSNIMSVYSIDELASSSTSTIVDEEETRHAVYQEPPDGMYPPRYFDPEERSASVASRDLPEDDEVDHVHRSQSQVSISSSLYSAVSKDLGHYANAFNDAMEPHNQPASIEVDTFNRKYSKRVSALQKANRQQSATLPRNRKSGQSPENNVTQTYTLPRKQTKEPGALTNFLNQTYSGRVPPSKSSDSRLLSRSLTFGSVSDYKKFEGDEWTRSLPRHLGRKAYMRHPSLRQVCVFHNQFHSNFSEMNFVSADFWTFVQHRISFDKLDSSSLPG